MDETGLFFAVDPFPIGRFGRSWQRPIAHREATKSENGMLVWLEEYSDKAFELFEKNYSESIDFIFIDGDHQFSGVEKDWRLWTERLAPNGRVALHDSRSWEQRSIDHVGAARFTRDVVLKDSRFELVDTCDSITVVERVAPG